MSQELGHNFILLMVAGLSILLLDLRLFVLKRRTFSETIWTINQRSLALAFIAGVIVGHLFTVPK